MYRDGREEVVICLDAKNGETVWEFRYEHAPWSGGQRGYGVGPRSTPLIAGEMLFTIGVAGKMLALNKDDGEVVWSHTLWDGEFRGNHLSHGYSSSPVACEDMVIVTVGDENASIVAFDQKTGRVKWKSPGFRNSFSSPQIGARGLRLAREGERIEVEEVWSSRRVQFYHGSSVMIGDWVYGSTGMTSPAFMTAINIRTGEIGWRERGISREQVLAQP